MSRSKAALQVAHQWRLLQATGRAASEPIVGLIGTERLTPPDAEDRRQHLVITWIDLNADGLLERYDVEHAERVRLASGALDGTDVPPDPVIHRECPYCVWLDRCSALLPADDLSLRIGKARLDPQEVRALSLIHI